MDCLECKNCRPKLDSDLTDYVECKATHNADVILAAFWQFSTHRESDFPFRVKSVPGHIDSVWPFQFKPESIEMCEGFTAKAEQV